MKPQLSDTLVRLNAHPQCGQLVTTNGRVNPSPGQSFAYFCSHEVPDVAE